MQLYFAGCSSDEFGINKFLFSQYNNRSDITKLSETLSRNDVKMFLDSGAYTAYTKGVSIDIDEYVDYINSLGDMVTVCAPVDVIPGDNVSITSEEAAQQSWDNFIYMRSRVVDATKLIPVFHQSEPFSNLIKMLQYEDEFGKVDYIGIGALANTRDTKTRDLFLTQCFSCISKVAPSVKVHGFGMTDLSLLERFPFYSADSTTWRMAAVMGEIITPFGRLIISDRRMNDYRNSLRSEQSVPVLQKFVESFGFTLETLQVDAEERAKFNVKYLQSWEANYVCKYVVKSIRKLF